MCSPSRPARSRHHEWQRCIIIPFARIRASSGSCSARSGSRSELKEERVWERRREFLALNPAGTTPVLSEESIAAVPGASVIAEYLDETRGLALGSGGCCRKTPTSRVEVRRLMGWFLDKFDAEVSSFLVTEKVYKRFMSSAEGGGAPDMVAIRAARTNLRYHLKYIGWLLAERNWLAGPRMTYADLAAAAQLVERGFSRRRAMGRG